MTRRVGATFRGQTGQYVYIVNSFPARIAGCRSNNTFYTHSLSQRPEGAIKNLRRTLAALAVAATAARAGSPPTDIWSSAGQYPSLGLAADIWLLKSSIAYPGLSSDSAFGNTVKIDYWRSSPLSDYSVSAQSIKLTSVTVSGQISTGGRTIGAAIGLPRLGIYDNLWSTNHEVAGNAAIWYTRPSDFVRGVSLWADGRYYQQSNTGADIGRLFTRITGDGTFGYDNRYIDLEGTILGMRTRFGAFVFVRAGGEFSRTQIDLRLERDFAYPTNDTIISQRLYGYPPDTTVDTIGSCISQRTIDIRNDNNSGRLSAGLAYKPDKRRWFTMEFGGRFASNTVDSTADTVPVARVFTSDYAKYPHGYWYETVDTVIRMPGSRFRDTASAFYTFSAHRRLRDRALRAVIGFDGRVEVRAFRTGGDPGFFESPSYFWNYKSHKFIRCSLPLLISWHRGPVTVFGSWVPGWDWYSYASPSSPSFRYRRSSHDLRLNRYSAGVYVRASQHLFISLVPELHDNAGIVKAQAGYAW